MARIVVLMFLLTFAYSQDRQKEEREAARHYERWLNQDVLYIITDDERAVFEKLTTADEKDRFIEQFWFRRDPDPATAANEFKEEHYRRIAYANQHYGSGIPGWKTDRGRIYVMFGEPAEIEHHTGGGQYLRPRYEGGGRTATYPFEIWRYRYIAGVGDDLELEFVDRSWSGEYKLAMNAWEKDLLLHVDGEGLTTAERLGFARKQYRPGLHPGNLNNLTFQKRMMGARSKDMPFEAMRRYFDLQRPPQIKQKELKTIVETHVSYATLPLFVALHHIWIDRDAAFVPVTVEVPNEGLDYIKTGALFRARVGLYGRVTSITGALVTEFEDRIASEHHESRFAAGQKQKSIYQKTLSLPAGIYKLELVVKDLNSGNIGTVSKSIHIPQLDQNRLIASPIVVARLVENLKTVPESPQSFVIADARVVPNVTHRFKAEDDLGVYLQVYNSALDASAGQPAVVIDYIITGGDGKVLTQITDKAGNSIHYFSEQRLVLMRKIKLSGLKKGSYKLRIMINDTISGKDTTSETEFEIV